MSDYTKLTDFAAKDSLLSGNPAKVVRGTEIDAEFTNIAVAVSTKTDDAAAAITGGTIDGTPIGGSDPDSGAFTTVSASGQITSTVSTGTAPLVIASTTKVANLNVDQLDGGDWASPGAIGGTTPAAGSFTTLAATAAPIIGASSGGEQLTFRSVVFSAGSGYSSYYADSVERMRVGWQNSGAPTGLVAAQVLMTGASDLTLASRDIAAGHVYIRAGSGIPLIGDFSSTGLAVTGIVTPEADNTRTLGTGALRWSTVYAGTGTINTSDAREKTPVSALTTTEINAAKQLSKEIGTYKFLASIQAKGDAARIHVGMTVQRAIEIMESHGLNPFDYGFICHDVWEDRFTEHPTIEAVAAVEAVPSVEEVKDADGNVITEAIPVVAAVEAVDGKAAWTEQVQWAGDRYAFRYDQLNLFIAAGIEARLAALEAA